MNKRFLFFLVISFFWWVESSAQDLHFSQHVTNPLYYNPAFTGVFSDKARLYATYADRYRQAFGKEGLKTSMASGDVRFPMGWNNRNALSVGAYFYHHTRGVNTITDYSGALSLAYRMPLDRLEKHHLSAGFQGVYIRRSLDYGNLQFGNQYDGFTYNPSIATGESLNLSPDNQFTVNLGVLYSGQLNDNLGVFGGVSAGRLLSALSDNSRISADTRFNVHGGLDYNKEKLGIHPVLMFDYQRSAFEIYTGSRISFLISEVDDYSTRLYTGAFVRVYNNPANGLNINTFNFMIGAQFSDFMASFYVDNSIGKTTKVFNGFNGFEVSLTYLIRDNKAGKVIYCPSL